MEWPHFECKYYSLWYDRRIAKNLYIELKGTNVFVESPVEKFGDVLGLEVGRKHSKDGWNLTGGGIEFHDLMAAMMNEYLYILTYGADLPKVVDNGSTSSIGNEYQKMLHRNIYKLLIIL